MDFEIERFAQAKKPEVKLPDASGKKSVRSREKVNGKKPKKKAPSRDQGADFQLDEFTEDLVDITPVKVGTNPSIAGKLERTQGKSFSKGQLLDLDSPDQFDEFGEGIRDLKELKEKAGQLQPGEKQSQDGKKPAGYSDNTSSQGNSKPQAASSQMGNANAGDKPQETDGKTDAKPEKSEEAKESPKESREEEAGRKDPAKNEAEKTMEERKTKEDEARIKNEEAKVKITEKIGEINKKITVLEKDIAGLENQLDSMIGQNTDNPDFDPEPLRIVIFQKKMEMERLRQEKEKGRLQLETLEGKAVGSSSLEGDAADSALFQAQTDRTRLEELQEGARNVIEKNLEFLKDFPGDLAKADLITRLSHKGSGLEAVTQMEGLQDSIKGRINLRSNKKEA